MKLARGRLNVKRTDGAQLEQLASNGAVWDGDLLSKSSRDSLVEAGLAYRAEGYNAITAHGIRLALAVGILHQGSDTNEP